MIVNFQANMCEKRIRKIKRASPMTRLREARRLQRLQWLAAQPPHPPHPTEAQRVPVAHAHITAVDPNAAQKRVILELALKTISLMQKNRLIQQKIIALQRETSEFVAAVMSNPESRRRYLEHVRLYAAGLITLVPSPEARDKPLKVEANT